MPRSWVMMRVNPIYAFGVQHRKQNARGIYCTSRPKNVFLLPLWATYCWIWYGGNIT